MGVDGSGSSKAALVSAIKQAGLTGAAVEAMIAWELPAAYGYPAPMTYDRVDFEELAGRVVTDAIAEVTAGTAAGEVRYKVVEGNAARVLLDAAAGADLLAVGNPGHGGFAEALLGSTGQHCVHHATCPVVAIRGSSSL